MARLLQLMRLGSEGMSMKHKMMNMVRVVAPLTLLLAACGNGDERTIVGSRDLGHRVTEVMFVEKIRISLPFTTVVYNGEPSQLVVRGEKNLISRIAIAESDVGAWEIVAPADPDFEQHADIEIEIPFIEMVEIVIDGDITFEDDPISVWSEGEREKPTEPSGD